ncbi:unnamed protein product [Symbiodinium pilosum]|uniref:Uncharacterized protein n=1 Tax=Symbiodinium pilosum TaxID=2952 RepID=A0A812YHR0_SYMPI|nr:unnamed protein product [Symbiodinium pilosum]
MEEACPCGGQGAGALRGTFVAPGGRPRTGPTGLKALENDQGSADTMSWLQKSWEGFNATYSKLWTGEQLNADDVQRDLDVTFAMSLAIGMFDSYVRVAPPAQPPDCVSYNTKGICCPSLACYKDLPMGLKIYVTLLLLLAMRGGVRMISENPSLSAGSLSQATQATGILWSAG